LPSSCRSSSITARWGLALQAIGLGWLAMIESPTVAYLDQVPAFVGMALFFAPVANVVFGIAVLGAVFSARGGYASGAAFVSGLAPAVWVGSAAARTAEPARELDPVR
jgi:hypothetical protein